MPAWQLDGPDEALRLVEPRSVTRSFDDEAFTWAKLIYTKLEQVEVFVLYLPSRFDLPLDKTCTDLLRAFGKNTSSKTSVNFWDPQDQNFEKALKLFNLSTPPAVVLCPGLALEQIDAQGPDDTDLYSISFTDQSVLGDRDRFVSAVNLAHDLLIRGDPQEITSYLRKRNLQGLLGAIGRIAGGVRDQLVLLKPKLGLPGGVSLGIGS